jgi:hypothetical protein
MLEAPLPQEEALGEELVRDPTSSRGPDFPELAERMEATGAAQGQRRRVP